MVIATLFYLKTICRWGLEEANDDFVFYRLIQKTTPGFNYVYFSAISKAFVIMQQSY